MNRIIISFILCAIMLIPTIAFAGHSHYVNGIEGIKAASVPPPGKYWRMYNVMYNANKRLDNNGDSTTFKADVFAVVNRFIYTTDKKILGADLVVGAIVPLTYTHLKSNAMGVNNTTFELGDIFVEPFVLSWHGKRSDSVLGIGAYLPTGRFNKLNLASPGKGYWTFMLTAGTTQYLSRDKSWHASILARYETHTDQRNTKTDVGDDFHFEWNIGKTLNAYTEIGISGYCQWQLQEDKGRYAAPGKEKIYAIGPEFNFNIPKWKTTINLRSLWEFGGKNATEGNITTLTFTRPI